MLANFVISDDETLPQADAVSQLPSSYVEQLFTWRWCKIKLASSRGPTPFGGSAAQADDNLNQTQKSTERFHDAQEGIAKEAVVQSPSRTDRLAGTTVEDNGVLANRDYPAGCYPINEVIVYMPSGAPRKQIGTYVVH